jgi:DNA-binding MarR family transcriptional regulator
LTNLQHLVLEGLWYEAGQTAAELGKMLVMDKATLSGVLDRMSEAGWIEKRPTPTIDGWCVFSRPRMRMIINRN